MQAKYMDELVDIYLRNPTEETSRNLIRGIARSFGDKSFNESRFNKFQDLIVHQTSKNLQYGGFSASDHFSNTLRSCFKHNKRNDLIVLLKPTSVKKFSDIHSFGQDTVALINKDVMAMITQTGGFTAQSPISPIDGKYDTDFNFKSTDAQTVSSMYKFPSEKREVKDKLIGGSIESSEMEFVTLQNEPRVSNAPRKTSSGSVVKSKSFIKTNTNLLEKRKSYTLRNKGDKNELSIFSSEGGQSDSLEQLNKIEKDVDELEKDSTFDLTDKVGDTVNLRYPKENQEISVDCMIQYLGYIGINLPSQCEQLYLNEMFDSKQRFLMNKYFDSNKDRNFVETSQELYYFINKFANETVNNGNMERYSDEQQQLILVNLHIMISEYIEFITNNLKNRTIANNNLITSADNLLKLHNKVITKTVDEGTSVENLQKHLDEFYALSKENLKNVDNLARYLSIGPKEAYDPVLLDQITKRAQELTNKIEALNVISNDMGKNIEALKTEFPIDTNVILSPENVPIKEAPVDLPIKEAPVDLPIKEAPVDLPIKGPPKETRPAIKPPVTGPPKIKPEGLPENTNN